MSSEDSSISSPPSFPRSETGALPLYPALLTPFGAHGEIAPGAIGPMLTRLESSGVTGFLVLGSTGEFPSMTFSEKREVLLEAAATRGKMSMMVGCGSSSLPETLELVRLAQDRGADALLVPPPFYFRTAPEEGIESFFAAVLEEATVPVLLYHVPMFTNIPLSRKLLKRLSKFPTLWGIKDTGGNIRETARFLSSPPGRVMLGSDVLISSGIKLGVNGVISACANIVPKWHLRILSSASQNEGSEERELWQKRLTDLKNRLKPFPSLSSMKYWLELDGIPMGTVRPPQMPLSDEGKEYIRSLKDSIEY